MSMRDFRRCHWYTDDGQPRLRTNGGFGCPRTGVRGCDFIHPDDPDWSMAQRSRPPPSFLLGFEPLSAPSRARVNRSLTPPARARTPPGRPPPRNRMPSGALSPRRERRGSMNDEDARVFREPVRGRPPSRERTASMSSVDARNASTRPLLDPRVPSRSIANGSDSRKDDKVASTSIARTASGSQARHPSPSMMPPPPPVIKPPPLPNGRSSQTPQPANVVPKKELTIEEKRAAWVERIKLMSDAVLARSDHLRLQREAQNYERLRNSWRFTDIAEEDKSRLGAQLDDLAAQVENKKKELNRIVTQLVDSDFWPFAQQGPPTAEEGAQEIRTIVTNLRRDVNELYDILGKINAQATSSVPNDQKPIPSLDEYNNSNHPAKRQRMSISGDALVDENPAVLGLRSEELNELLDRLTALEDQLSDLQNDMVQFDNDLLTEVDDRIQTRIDEVRLSGESSKSGPSSADLRRLEQELNVTGNQLGELAMEVANLISQTSEHELENTRLREENDRLKQHYHSVENIRLREENEQLKQRVRILEQQQKRNNEQIEAYGQEMRALNAAVTAAMARPPDLPPITPVLSIDSVLEAIKPHLVQTIHDDVQPLLEGMHAAVGKMLHDQAAKVNNAVLSQLTPTVKTVEVISSWMKDKDATDNLRRVTEGKR